MSETDEPLDVWVRWTLLILIGGGVIYIASQVCCGGTQ